LQKIVLLTTFSSIKLRNWSTSGVSYVLSSLQDQSAYVP